MHLLPKATKSSFPWVIRKINGGDSDSTTTKNSLNLARLNIFKYKNIHISNKELKIIKVKITTSESF